jgi:hypothetical protein
MNHLKQILVGVDFSAVRFGRSWQVWIFPRPACTVAAFDDNQVRFLSDYTPRGCGAVFGGIGRASWEHSSGAVLNIWRSNKHHD